MDVKNSDNVVKGSMRVRGIYKGTEAKKGFKGFWQMKYVFHDLTNVVTGECIKSVHKFNDVKSIKGKNFKIDDTVEMTVTVEVVKGKLKISRPRDVEKV